MKTNPWQSDIDFILAKRHDNGADFWATPDGRVAKSSPFSTLESASMLLELGVDRSAPVMQGAFDLMLGHWREDGRFRIAPQGAIYPCQTIHVARVLCHAGYAADARLQRTFDHLLATPYLSGGWRCNKFIYGKGPETDYCNPGPTLSALDVFRYADHANAGKTLDDAVAALLAHWEIRRPLGPCQFGIGSLFMQIAYPFSAYNLFFYVYTLSFYERARNDERFHDALRLLQSKLRAGGIVVERPNPRLAGLRFCRKGEVSALATARYEEILNNLQKARNKSCPPSQANSAQSGYPESC